MNTQLASDFKCEHCNKIFGRESTLLRHACEPKRRFNQRTERGVQLGLRAYQLFYELAMPTASAKKWQDFETSPYYAAFVKFGRYLVECECFRPEDFVRWLIKTEVKLDRWCMDTVYTTYICELVRTEGAEQALTRSLETINQQCEEMSCDWTDFFSRISPLRFLSLIAGGHISPWLIHHCSQAITALEQLTDNQLAGIMTIIDPNYWAKRFKERGEDSEYAEELLTKAGLR